MEEEDAVGRGGWGALKASLRSWLTAFHGVIHKVDQKRHTIGTTPNEKTVGPPIIYNNYTKYKQSLYKIIF